MDQFRRLRPLVRRPASVKKDDDRLDRADIVRDRRRVRLVVVLLLVLVLRVPAPLVQIHEGLVLLVRLENTSRSPSGAAIT